MVFKKNGTPNEKIAERAMDLPSGTVARIIADGNEFDAMIICESDGAVWVYDLEEDIAYADSENYFVKYVYKNPRIVADY